MRAMRMDWSAGLSWPRVARRVMYAVMMRGSVSTKPTKWRDWATFSGVLVCPMRLSMMAGSVRPKRAPKVSNPRL